MKKRFEMTKKTGIVAMAMLYLLLFIPNPGFAQLYKDKTVTVLIGHPAGGGIDRMARGLFKSGRAYIGFP